MEKRNHCDYIDIDSGRTPLTAKGADEKGES